MEFSVVSTEMILPPTTMELPKQNEWSTKWFMQEMNAMSDWIGINNGCIVWDVCVIEHILVVVLPTRMWCVHTTTVAITLIDDFMPRIDIFHSLNAILRVFVVYRSLALYRWNTEQ